MPADVDIHWNALAYELLYTGFHIHPIKMFLYREQGRLYATMFSQLKTVGYHDFKFLLIFRFRYSNCSAKLTEHIDFLSLVWNVVHVVDLNSNQHYSRRLVKLFFSNTYWSLLGGF